MKMNSCLASLFVAVIVSAPALSANEVERLRALVAEQELQIQQLELKVAQLTNSTSTVSSTPAPATTKATSKPKATTPAKTTVEATIKEEEIPKAITCPEPVATQDPSIYIVQAGDHMVSIAKKHNTTSAKLNELNGLKKGAIIRPGQKLKIPAATQIATVETPVAEPEVAKTEPLVGAPAPTPAPEPEPIKHSVTQNETYYSIAKKYNVTVDQLIKSNPSINPKALRIGQVVQIPAKQQATEAPAVTSTEQAPSLLNRTSIPVSNTPATESQSRASDKPIKITKEITYSDFAKIHNTTTSRLDELNGLRLDPTTILAQGSELYVPQQP